MTLLSDEAWSTLEPTDPLLRDEVDSLIEQGQEDPGGPANFAVTLVRRNPGLDPRSAAQLAHLEGELVRAKLTAKITTAVSIAFVMFSVARSLARA